MSQVGGVIVTHGQLANELLLAAEMVVGEINQVVAVSIGWHDDVEVARAAIEKAVLQANVGDGVVVLTDLFGGTPTNLVMTYSGPIPIEIITGVNLPMVIKLATQKPGQSLGEVARKVRDQGRKDIYLASELVALDSRKTPEAIAEPAP
jgi:mannose PTS system EIIA component